MPAAPSDAERGPGAEPALSEPSSLALSGYAELIELGRSLPIQRSALQIGPRDDPFEHQAEHVAAIVAGAATPSLASLSLPPGTAALGAAPPPPATGGAPGEALSAGVRAQVEPLLDTSLAGVRVHHGHDAHRMADRLEARAFTHGSNIYLGAGESPHDAALMAHEATHAVQQATGAVPAIRRIPDGASSTGNATAAAPSPLPELPSGELKPLGAPEASLLVLGLGPDGKHGVFVIPARGLVYELPRRTPAGGPQKQGPAMGLPAVGHASTVLVRTGTGVGMLVDAAGSRTGGPLNVLIPPALQALSARFGISRIDAVLIAHTHADHVGGLIELARQGAVTGGDVYVQPGLETATQGPAGQAFQQLATGTVSPAFPAGWRPTPLGITEITGPTGQRVTTSRLVVGDATIEMATETQVLRDFVAAVRAGRTKEASRLADAASALALIAPRGAPAMLKVGDMRGRDIERLYSAMGDAAFRAMFGRARLLEGLHHLGAVSSRADVRGLEILLSVVGNRGGEPFTVVAQTGPDREINPQLIRAIQLAGGRVVAVGEPDAAKPGEIDVRHGGQVTQTGGREWGADPVTARTRARVQRLERAIRVLETLPDYRSGPAPRAEILAGLRAQAQRLRGALDARRQIGLDGVGPRGRTDGEQRLRDNTIEAEKVLGMEQQVGDAQLAKLAVTDAELTELDREVRAVRQRGEASTRLRALLSTIDPQIGRELLFDALGQPLSRNQQRRAWRMLLSRIRAQQRTEALAQLTGPAPMRAKAAAWFGLVLQAWELAEPFVTQAVRESREASHEDFYRGFRDLVWWTEKGIYPYTTGRAAAAQPDQDETVLLPGIWRRVLDDLPVVERSQQQAGLIKSNPQLMKDVAGARALQFLYIPDPAGWPGDKREAFWNAVAQWASAHINNYHDYASEMMESPIQPIRQAPDQSKGFGARDWQLRVGTVSGDHVLETWQTSPDLTRILNATAQRVMANTGRERDDAWTNRQSGAPSDTPVLHDPAHPARFVSDQPTAKARFSGKPQPIYALLDGEVTKVARFQFWTDTPHFFVHANMKTPKGYAWVSGADYNTHAALRSATIWQFLRSSRIQREKHDRDPSSPTFDKRFEPSEYMDEPGELDAWTRYINHEPGAFFHAEDGSVYRGEVRLFILAPNITAMALVEVDELTREPA